MRELSIASRATVDTLEQIELEVIDMERVCADAEDVLQKATGDQLDPKMRNELAQARDCERKSMPVA